MTDRPKAQRAQFVRRVASAGLVLCTGFAAAPALADGATVRDPMQPPPDARPATPSGPGAAAAAPEPARHLMVIDGRRYVVWGGRKRGIGDPLGDAQIVAIEDNAVTVRQDGALHRLPLHGAVQRRPAAESPALAAPAAAGLRRPARPADGAVSLARPAPPPRPELRSAIPYRAGEPQ
jgi:hypothetical protein